jgi:hypothetical protein
MRVDGTMKGPDDVKVVTLIVAPRRAAIAAPRIRAGFLNLYRRVSEPKRSHLARWSVGTAR